MAVKEKGVVVNTKGELLVVKVIREKFSGESCCRASGSEAVFVEARNDCGAAIGDTVDLDGSIEREAGSQALRVGIYVAAFLVGLIAGEYAAPQWHLEQWKEGFSFGLGFVLAALAFLLVKLFSGNFKGKKETHMPSACGVVALLP
jgi:hypothetical protein